MVKFSSGKTYSNIINSKYFLIFLILLFIVPFSQAQSEDKILFLDGNKNLVFTINLPNTINISVINERNVSENISVWISDFSTAAGDHILSSDIQMPYTKNITPGGLGVFPITFKKDSNVAPGTYSGKVTASSSGADIISKDITIIIPSNVSKLNVLTKDITIEGTSRIPTLPCCTTFTEKKVYFGTNSTVNLSNLNISGVITNGAGKEGKIILQTEKAVYNDTYIAVPLEVQGIDSPGKYNGTVYLDPSDPSNSQKINVVVIVNDFMIWPFLVILLGVVVSYGLTYWWNDGRLRKKIADKIWLLNREAVMYHRSFGEEHGYMPYCHYSTHHSIQLKLGELEKDARTADPDELDSVKKDLDKINKYLENFTPFLIEAEKLFNKFIFCDRVLAERFEQVDPVFFQDIRNLLVGQQISIFNETDSKSELADLEKKLQDSELFLDSFYRMYNKLNDSEEIMDFVTSDISKHKFDKKIIEIINLLKQEIKDKKYVESLAKIRETLWKASTLQSLVNAKTEDSLNEIAIYALKIRQEKLKLAVLPLKNYFEARQAEKSLGCNPKPSTIELFWNHQNAAIRLTPETHNWLKTYKPESPSPKEIEDKIEGIKEYAKNKKIEYRPQNVLRGTDVEIWSDMGFALSMAGKNEKRRLLPFEWIIYKSEKESAGSENNVTEKKLNVPGWDLIVPSTRYTFKDGGKYFIQLKIGQQELLPRKEIEVKGIEGWVKGIISSGIKGLSSMFWHIMGHIFEFPRGFPTFLASSMVAFATILIASILGITLLYSNQGFGSLTDYLAALVWGSTADQATKLITPLFGKITK